jgi:hypothetical protein
VELTLDKLCTRRSRDKLGVKFKKLVRPKEELEVEKTKILSSWRKHWIKKTRRGNFEVEQGEKVETDVIKYICGFLNCMEAFI